MNKAKCNCDLHVGPSFGSQDPTNTIALKYVFLSSINFEPSSYM